MAQNIGSALLGGFQGAMAMGQQRRENQLARDRLEMEGRRLDQVDRQFVFDQEKFEDTRKTNEAARLETERKQARENNDQWIRSNYPWLTTNRLNIDMDKVRAGVESGDKATSAFLLDIVNRSNAIPKGSKATEIVATPGGGYSVTIVNADGSQGGLTVDGTSNPDSPMKQFAPGEVAAIANTYYRTQIASNSNIFDPFMMSNYENLTDAEIAALEDLQRESTVFNSIPQEGGASRAAASIISSTQSPDERNSVVEQIATDTGAPPRQTRPASQTQRAETKSEYPGKWTSSMTPEEALAWADNPDNLGKKAPFNEREFTDWELWKEQQGGATSASASQDTGSDVQRDTDIERLQKLSSMPGLNAMMRANPSVKEEYESLKSRYSPKEVEAFELRKLVNKPGRAAAKDNEWRAAKERLTQLEKEIAEEKASSIIPADPAAAEEFNQFAETVADLPPEEIVAAAESGDVQVTPAVAQGVADKLQEKNIRKVSDLKRLNLRDRAITRAVIIASPGVPPNIRQQYAVEMSNLFQTGVPSISAAQAEANRIAWAGIENDRANIGLRAREGQRATGKDLREIIDKNTETAVGFVEATRDIFLPEDEDKKRPSRPLLTRDRADDWINQALPSQLLQINNAQSPLERDRLIDAMNQGMSWTLAALAQDGDAGIFETMVSWFRSDPGAVSNPADFRLQRVRMTEADGKPVSFYYVDERGNRTGTAISARQIQNKSPDLYEALYAASKHNRDRQR